MEFRNRHGKHVDPVPFYVAVSLIVLVGYSYAPLYFMEFGFSVVGALGLSTAVAGAFIAGAYHRYVWTLRPELLAETPAELRMKRLLYGAAIVVAGMALLALPLFLR